MGITNLLEFPQEVFQTELSHQFDFQTKTQAASSCWFFNDQLRGEILLNYFSQVFKSLIWSGKGESKLKNTPSLLGMRMEKITDYGGRTFKNITLLQYALWALDYRMWEKILSCLPDNTQRHALKLELQHQYEEWKTCGVTYELNGKEYHEKYYNFGLIDALGGFINSQPEDLQNVQGWRQRFVEQVGEAQRMAPMHVMSDYFKEDRSKDNELPRSKNYHQYKSNPADQKTNVEANIKFALLRGERKISALFAVRTDTTLPMQIPFLILDYVKPDYKMMINLRDRAVSRLEALDAALQMPNNDDASKENAYLKKP